MKDKKNNFIVAGIGASAGGLEALRQTLPGLPDSEDIAYVIVQHMDPHHQSMLVSLLQSSTTMKVSEAENKQELLPNEIYITPPGFDILLKNGKIELHKPEALIGPRPSVDRFLISLAEEKGGKSVGIILSGTGSDGAHGMRAIKAGGGITIVQEPKRAKYDGMPISAIKTGSIDLILPPESIGPELLEIIHNPLLVSDISTIKSTPDDEGRLMVLLRKYTGYDFSEYKKNTLHRRINRRLAVHKMKGINEYIAYAEENPSDLEGLAKDMLISVTSFFRDQQAFDALRKIIPDLVKDKHDNEPVRVWVPGCATGEEAYSLAILFAEYYGEAFGNIDLQFYATDIDVDVVSQARKGIYPAATLESVDKKIIDKYFIQDNGHYRIVKSIRDQIVFAKQDIVSDPPFSRLDLITCRNLLIYFEASLQDRIINMFHFVLNAKGVLFLGKSESVSRCADLFQPISKKWRILQRIETANAFVKSYQATPPLRYALNNSLSTPRNKVGPSPQETLNNTITNVFGPPAVLINSKMELIYARGNASKYFQIGEGDIGLSALELARPEIRSILRTSIYKAQREHQAVINRKIRVQLPEKVDLYINLHVHPIDSEGVPDGFLLVAFEEEPINESDKHDEIIDRQNSRDQRIVDLEHELAAVYERLQTTVEELETSNEELQSLNEELQSANEELQSTNEEMETSNEELQASNEELSTLNDELQARSAELARANSDLENVFKRLIIPLIVIDKEMKIRLFTPSANTIFNLMPDDQGQVITNLGTRVTIPNFRQLLDDVIQNGTATSHTLTSETKTYEFKIFPYFEEDKTISGALLTFYDMTSTYQRKQEFEALAENAPDIVVRFDLRLRHLYLNKAIEKYTGRKREEFIGKTNRELGMPEDMCQLWDEEFLKPVSTLKDNSFEFEFPSVTGVTHFHSRVVPEFSSDGRVASLLLVTRDITSEKKYLQELTDTLGSISDGFFSLDSNLCVTYFNEAAGKLLGKNPEEVHGKKLFDVFPEAKGSIFEEQYRLALELKQGVVFETFFEPHKNWYSVRVFPKENGISVYFQVTTAQKEAQKELEHQKEILQAIIDNSPVMITMFDQKVNVLLVNRAFEEKSGWAQNEINSIDIMERCYPDPVLRAEVLHYMQKASIEWKEIEMTTKNGETLDTMWSNVRLDDKTMIGIGLDITEKKKIEDSLRESQKIDSLGTLAGGIAHDFNNILSAIIGYAEIAKEDLPESSPVTTSLKHILTSGKRASELVKQILTFSRRQRVDNKELNPSPIISEAINFIRATLPATVDIIEEIDPDCGSISANETNIHQIVINLCTNAVHAMENEKGKLFVKLAQVQVPQGDLKDAGAQAGSFVELLVEDTGCGMDQDTLSRIFEPYYTTKEVGKGSGLGLSLVHGILQSCGGFIQVDSTPGKGSQFRLCFPVIEEHPIANDDEEQTPVKLLAPVNERILFVDDEKALTDMNKVILERNGYQVTGTTSSRKAFDLFSTSPDDYDLIITDQTMPNVSGAELAAQMLEIRPDIPIILCTGFSSIITEEKALEMGIKRFLMKPVARKTLLTAVREILDEGKL
ncbi:MAG: chemotaxis protein CheB [Desulforhopalus sp.]